MTATQQNLGSAKGWSNLSRAKFGPGMLLQHDDLEQLSEYTRELNRLMFRSLFGCGVICGLVVSSEPKCGKVLVTITAGLALDCCGDPIHVPTSQSIPVQKECDDVPAELWVVLCATAKCCSPRPSNCVSDDDEATSQCTRERDGFEIRVLEERPECACGCQANDKDLPSAQLPFTDSKCKCANPELGCLVGHYAGECGCGCEPGDDCACDCIVLARLEKKTDPVSGPQWIPDHSVRRFIRPVLMRDPQVATKPASKPSASTASGSEESMSQLKTKVTKPAASESSAEPGPLRTKGAKAQDSGR